MVSKGREKQMGIEGIFEALEKSKEFSRKHRFFKEFLEARKHGFLKNFLGHINTRKCRFKKKL